MVHPAGSIRPESTQSPSIRLPCGGVVGTAHAGSGVDDAVRASVFAWLDDQVRCTICRLAHLSLLDAAHIRSDALGGAPVVTNGMAMCKIHHAAYDGDLLSVGPDGPFCVRREAAAGRQEALSPLASGFDG